MSRLNPFSKEDISEGIKTLENRRDSLRKLIVETGNKQFLKPLKQAESRIKKLQNLLDGCVAHQFAVEELLNKKF